MAQQHLTEKLVKALPAPARGNKLYYDDAVKGFAVRVTANGAKAFVLNYYIHGRERRHTIGLWPAWTVTAARDTAKELRQDVDQGIDPLAVRIEKREAPSIANLYTEYKAKHLPTKRDRSRKDDEAMWKLYILDDLGPVKLAELTAAHVDALHRKIGAEKPIRANRVIEVLSKALNLAVRWEWVSRNVAQGVTMYPEEPRHRYASPAELSRVLDAMAQHPHQDSVDVLRMIILTGARKGEVFRARWQDIDLHAGTWTKPSSHTKQKRLHQVPLSATAIELLRRRKEGAGDSTWVFPGRKSEDAHITDVKKTWESCREVATIALWREDPRAAALIAEVQESAKGGVTAEKIMEAAQRMKLRLPTGSLDLRIHDLRHTYASMLISNRVPLAVIGALLGHTQAQTTLRYAHLQDDPLRAATEIAAAKVNGVANRKAAEA